ncbi:FAD-dependent monooxygenase [Streptomyces sp. NPDC057499]|uniref:FAD-dependent monooxygenase n=1 Tax=Streptomyces sp. NPDC057499 TaxID=3346150 RepID=UPI0036CD0F2F
MDVTTTDVLVVGAGPTGLTAAALLARYGIDAITVAKHPGTATAPRAHITNQRTMEIFRDLGIEDDVRRVATPLSDIGFITWAVSFSGTELARLSAWGTGPDRRGEYESTSPCAMVNAPQHVLEPVILAEARRRGADVRFGVELLTLEEGTDHVLATVRDRSDGREHRIQARYVVGADGAHSTVSRQAEIPSEGDGSVRNWAISVWLEADLTRYCAYRPSALYWMHQPGEDLFSATWICVRPWTEWVMVVVYPAQHEEPALEEATALAYARAMIDDPLVEVRIKSIGTWSVGQALATTYSKSRVFLAGDAAHRHPPPNGLGSNTGVQDAYNLCWKLAMVLSGQAGPALLDSYDAERQPVGRTIVDRVMRSLENMEPLTRAFGLETGLDARQGHAQIAELAADSDRGRDRRNRLRKALDLQHYQYNCHGVECGQRYTSGAVLDAGLSGSGAGPDEQLHYRPSTCPGAHLPHAWVEHERQPLSTLDVVTHDRFTVVTGIGGQTWTAAAEKASAALGMPLTVVAVDCHEQYHDAQGDWARIREIDGSGCLLVRPDRHIAWRAPHCPSDPAAELTDVLRQLLAHGSK